MLIGYARVLTNDQDTTAQASALKATGCEQLFREKATAAPKLRVTAIPFLVGSISSSGRQETLRNS